MERYTVFGPCDISSSFVIKLAENEMTGLWMLFEFNTRSHTCRQSNTNHNRMDCDHNAEYFYGNCDTFYFSGLLDI